jgi:hypothetical protein
LVVYNLYLTRKPKKDDVTQINEIYRDLNQKESKLEKSIKNKQLILVYISFFRNLFIVVLIVLGFCSYRSPTFLSYILSILPVYLSLPAITAVFVLAHYYSEYELRQVIKLEEKRKELQG